MTSARLLEVLDQRAFCESLVTQLGHETFDATTTICGIRGFDGEPPFDGNNFCCVEATDALSEFRGLVEINGGLFCFIAQINASDQHRTAVPAQDVLADSQASHDQCSRSFKR